MISSNFPKSFGSAGDFEFHEFVSEFLGVIRLKTDGNSLGV